MNPHELEWMMRERQRQLLHEAEIHRMLAEARRARRAEKAEPRSNPLTRTLASLRTRLTAAFRWAPPSPAPERDAPRAGGPDGRTATPRTAPGALRDRASADGRRRTTFHEA